MSHMDTIAQLSQYEFMILIDYLTQGIESFSMESGTPTNSRC